MSDARNSSGNIRGGGAKQTGGAGRTNKAAAGNTSKSELLMGANGLAKQNERSEAKRKLQLQVTSKELAASVRDQLLTYHTEEEYNAHDIPLPSTEDAKQKLKAMKEFTQKWYDKEFREQWLKTVTEVWLEELKAQYEAAVQAAMAAHKNKNSTGADGEGEVMSIEELEEAIANLDVNDASLSEERQRLKKKLKRKKQKQKDKEKKKGN